MYIVIKFQVYFGKISTIDINLFCHFCKAVNGPYLICLVGQRKKIYAYLITQDFPFSRSEGHSQGNSINVLVLDKEIYRILQNSSLNVTLYEP